MERHHIAVHSTYKGRLMPSGSIRKYPPALKAATCKNRPIGLQGKSMYWFLHDACLYWKVPQTGISIAIIPTPLAILYCCFGVSLCYLLCGELLLIFHLDITCIVLFMRCTTDVSLEFPTIYQIYQHFSFVYLASRFHWKVQCLFCIFCF